MRACVHQDASAAEVLLVGGANLNVVETDLGFSPLMFAASQGSAPVVKLLLQRGALVNAKSKVGAGRGHLHTSP
jgi:ankyrin repeat protein